jgi:hypothetical protein
MGVASAEAAGTGLSEPLARASAAMAKPKSATKP